MVEKIAMQIILGLAGFVYSSVAKMTIGDIKKDFSLLIECFEIETANKLEKARDHIVLSAWRAETFIVPLTNHILEDDSYLIDYLENMLLTKIKEENITAEKIALAEYMILSRMEEILPRATFFHPEKMKALAESIDELKDTYENNFG